MYMSTSIKFTGAWVYFYIQMCIWIQIYLYKSREHGHICMYKWEHIYVQMGMLYEQMFIFICTNEYLYMYKWACLYEQMVIFICTNDYHVCIYIYKWVSLYVQVSICTCTNAHTYMYRIAFTFVQMSIRVQITRPVTNEASGRCCVINDMQNAFSCFVWDIFCDIYVIDSVWKYKYKILTNTHTVYVYANAKLCVI